MGAKKYAKEVVKEGKRVRWPKKEIFFPTLIAVVIICVFCALILSLEDWAAGTLIGQLKELFAGIKKTSSETTSETTSEVVSAIRLFF